MSRIIIKQGNLLGVIDELGRIIIKPSYEKIRSFRNGLAAVCQDGRWGFVDTEGRLVIDLLYHDAKDFSKDGLAPVKTSAALGSWGLVDKEGKLIERENNQGYYNIENFNAYGYSIAKYYAYYYIIDTSGQHISEEAYHWLEYNQDQEIFIGEPVGKLCLINPKGQVEIDPDDKYDMIYYPSEGLCQVEKNDKMGYINEEGKLVIPLKYKLAMAFADNGLAYVEYANGRGAYIDKEGNFLIKPIFHSGTKFENGRAAVSKDGQYIFIDKKGEKSINYIFKEAGGFAKCGLAKVKLQDGRKGFIKANGQMAFILEEEWEVDEFIGDKTISPLRIGDKVGLVDYKGRIVLEPSYDEIILSQTNNIHLFSKDGLWGYIDDQANVIIENTYDKASEFTEEGLASVEYKDPIKDEDIKNYINFENEILDHTSLEAFRSYFADEYYGVEGFCEGLSLATKRENLKVLNYYGKEIKGQDFKLLLEGS